MGTCNGGKANHGANLNGDKRTLPEFEERDAASAVSAEDVSEELIQEGRWGYVEITARFAGPLFIQGHVYAVYIIFSG
jgi:hypothetical protein